MTASPTRARGRYALLRCLLVLLSSCASNDYTASESGSSQAAGDDMESSGGESADYAAYESAPGLAAPAPAPSGEIVLTGSRISKREEKTVKAKAASEHDSLGPASAAPTPGSPEHDTASAEQHGLALIYDAHVHLGVFESQRTIDAAETLAREAGGYLVHRDDRRITVRVPAVKFQATLAAVLLLGDVLHRQVNVRDVTEEFMDLRVRLRNAEAVRERLEQLLARADKVDQALAVERELERVAGEIEQIKGRLSLLQELTAFSTVTIELQPRAKDHLDSRVRLPFPWLDELGLSGLLTL